MTILDEISAFGHENILCTHKTTIELTKDEFVSKKGNCILGIKASKSCSDLNTELKNQIFNVGNTEENYRILDVAELVNQVVPNSIVEFAEGAEPDKRTYRVDFSKIKSYLPAFQPIWTVKKGSEELLQAYKENNMIMESLEGAKFKRLKHLQKLIDQGRIGTNLKWENGD